MTTDSSRFDDLIHTCEASGVDAMLDALAASLAALLAGWICWI